MDVCHQRDIQPYRFRNCNLKEDILKKLHSATEGKRFSSLRIVKVNKNSRNILKYQHRIIIARYDDLVLSYILLGDHLKPHLLFLFKIKVIFLFLAHAGSLNHVGHLQLFLNLT